MAINRLNCCAAARWSSTLCLAGALMGMSVTLTACDREVSSSKSTSTKTTETPEGTKKTTETTEKRVETERKDPK